MGLVINHNLMAMNAARNLNTIYNQLATSTQRLSSGLRINSAADDAAGLAIRELMRSDIAVLNQGLRNAADGISLIQTAEGALSVIDEKLTRMKELAEQASTGTYTTVQREIMNSEYQAMAAEIDRIANATDFNGIKLLDGSISNLHGGSGLKVHFGTGNDAAEDYYFINLGDARATVATGLKVGGDAKNDIWGTAGTGGAGNAAGCCDTKGVEGLNTAMNQSGNVIAFSYDHLGTKDYETNGQAISAQPYYASFIGGMYAVESSAMTLSDLINEVNKGSQSRIRIDFARASATGAALFSQASGDGISICIGNEAYNWGHAASNDTEKTNYTLSSAGTAANALASAINIQGDNFWAMVSGGSVYVFAKEGGDKNTMLGCDVASGTSIVTNSGVATISWHNLETGVNNSAGTTFSLGGNDWVQAKGVSVGDNRYGIKLEGRDVGEYFDIRILDVGSASVSAAEIQLYGLAGTNEITNLSQTFGLGTADFTELQDAINAAWAGGEIRTQSAAQEALDALQSAIIKKDGIRADLGALQNRLENTMTNISIQAEMLQASESRISDVDVATEMTEFTKNNIMAQAATSMLAQANSLAQLALSLMG